MAMVSVSIQRSSDPYGQIINQRNVFSSLSRMSNRLPRCSSKCKNVKNKKPRKLRWKSKRMLWWSRYWALRLSHALETSHLSSQSELTNLKTSSSPTLKEASSKAKSLRLSSLTCWIKLVKQRPEEREVLGSRLSELNTSLMMMTIWTWTT